MIGKGPSGAGGVGALRMGGAGPPGVVVGYQTSVCRVRSGAPAYLLFAGVGRLLSTKVSSSVANMRGPGALSWAWSATGAVPQPGPLSQSAGRRPRTGRTANRQEVGVPMAARLAPLGRPVGAKSR